MAEARRHLSRRALPALAILTLAAAALAAPAAAPAATVSHPFLEKLTGGAADPGQSHPQNPFEDACGVAKDSNGYVYVSDYHHDAIDVFGGFQNQFVTEIKEVDPGNGPCALAVDGAGDIYVNNWREDVVKWTPASYPPGQFTTYTPQTIDASGSATGLALDAASGHLFVDDGTYISEYDSSGTLLAKIGEDSTAEYFALAVNESSGHLYVANAKTATVKVFEASGAPIEEITGAGTPQHGFDYLGDAALAIDNSASSPSYGHLFVVDNIQHRVSENPEAVLDEFNSQGEFRAQIARWFVKEGEPKVLVEYWLTDAEPSGLALSSKGEVLITNGNTEGSVLDVFGPTATGELLSVTKGASTGAGTVTSKPAGIDCGPACVAEYDEGAEVKLTATPDAHSAFKGWTGCDSVSPPVPPNTTETCRVTMSAAKAVSAEFEALPQQNLTVGVAGAGEGTVRSEPAGIECSVGSSPCTEHFNKDSTVILTETPAPHSRFTGWGLPCDESTATTCEVKMSADETASAGFAAIPPKTLTVSLSGEGTVTSSPAGIACPGSCAAPFDSEGPASAVTLTAAPAPHFEVAWSGCEAQPGPDECTVTMSQARTVDAAFTPIPRTLTVQVAGQGTVSADHGPVSACGAGGSCSGSYIDGEVVTLSAAPAQGQLFSGWSDGPCGGTGPCEVRLEADTAVRANFTPIVGPTEEPPPARLSLGKLSVHGAAANLAVAVSGPGTLSAAGKDLKRAVAHPQAAGSLTLRLALSGTGRKALRRAKGGRLAVRITLTFAPADGRAAVATTRVVTFGKHHRPRRRR